MKKLLFVLALTVLLFCGCSQDYEPDSTSDEGFAITDVYGNTVYLPYNARVVSAYGSFSECFILAGGELVGVTSDALSERGLDLPANTEIIGTVKDVNFERILGLSPDYVILSADIANQLSMAENLERFAVPHGYFRVDSFGDYKAMMRQFCGYTGRDDLYAEHVEKVERNIAAILDKAPENTDKTYLLMRVYSTGIKVKNDNIADSMLKELGAVSISDETPSLLQDFSTEQVLYDNPDYIFVSTMGNETAGTDYFYENIVENPVWQGLSAIKNNNFTVLPKELFHYKPNNRWDKSYEYLAKILYPEIYKDEHGKE